jgi:hypothetical protein
VLVLAAAVDGVAAVAAEVAVVDVVDDVEVEVVEEEGADVEALTVWLAAMQPARATAVATEPMPAITLARWAGWGRRRGELGCMLPIIRPVPPRRLGAAWDDPLTLAVGAARRYGP